MGGLYAFGCCLSIYVYTQATVYSNQSYHREAFILGGVGQIDVTAYEHSTTGAVCAPYERSGELERIGCAQSMYSKKTFGALSRLFGWLYFAPPRAEVF